MSSRQGSSKGKDKKHLYPGCLLPLDSSCVKLMLIWVGMTLPGLRKMRNSCYVAAVFYLAYTFLPEEVTISTYEFLIISVSYCSFNKLP